MIHTVLLQAQTNPEMSLETMLPWGLAVVLLLITLSLLLYLNSIKSKLAAVIKDKEKHLSSWNAAQLKVETAEGSFAALGKTFNDYKKEVKENEEKYLALKEKEAGFAEFEKKYDALVEEKNQILLQLKDQKDINEKLKSDINNPNESLRLLRDANLKIMHMEIELQKDSLPDLKTAVAHHASYLENQGSEQDFLALYGKKMQENYAAITSFSAFDDQAHADYQTQIEHGGVFASLYARSLKANQGHWYSLVDKDIAALTKAKNVKDIVAFFDRISHDWCFKLVYMEFVSEIGDLNKLKKDLLKKNPKALAEKPIVPPSASVAPPVIPVIENKDNVSFTASTERGLVGQSNGSSELQPH